ncbi:hypothetical protein SDC9_152168 [bioreactor metagenome]|uniref:Uncharacterized protein n=1 Tax=bioreactor metagenome TaxID=1076179 RepID=A0A645EU13_9ZZZZ
MGDDICRAAGNQQFARVGGHSGGVSSDFIGIADLVYLDDQINLILGNAGRVVRIRQQLFRQ